MQGKGTGQAFPLVPSQLGSAELDAISSSCIFLWLLLVVTYGQKDLWADPEQLLLCS